MTGLRLRLRPGERILINGAVVQNGHNQIELRVLTPNAKILRLRDALHPETVDTPTKRVCYIAQLVVAGDLTPEEAKPKFVRGVVALKQVFLDPGSQEVMEQALQFAHAGNFYKAMQCMRRLLPYEQLVMGNPAYVGRGSQASQATARAACRENVPAPERVPAP